MLRLIDYFRQRNSANKSMGGGGGHSLSRMNNFTRLYDHFTSQKG